MKNITHIVVLLIIPVISSCSGEKRPADDRLQVEVIQTPGVLCGSCAKIIEAALDNVEGINEIDVDVEKKLVEIKFLSTKVNLQLIETAIARVGYDANGTKRDLEAYNRLDACCRVDG